MPPLYIVEQGAKLRVEKQRLLVTRDDETIATVPFAHTSAVVIFGNTAITTPAMKRLMQGGIFEGLRTGLHVEWAFQTRTRRPPTDPVNVLLSFGYTLLTRALEASIHVVGLDPHIGILHRTEYGRPSLALDLAEEFRAVIVDSVVMRCLNNSIITLADFTETDEGPYPLLLSDAARRRFIQEYEARLETQIQHPITGEQMNYRRVFELQVRLLARAIRQPEEPYKPFTVR